MQNFYKRGEYNAICDVCGFKFKSSQLMRRWDGARVCRHDWETRHPLDLHPVVVYSSLTTVVVTGNILTEVSERTLTESGDNLIW